MNNQQQQLGQGIKLANKMFIRRSNYNRNYKYSHPLAGKVYDNQTYASKCPSFLDKQGNSRRKLSTSGSEEPSSRVQPNRYQTLLGQNTRREVISTRKVHSAVNDSFPVQNRQSREMSVCSRKNATWLGGSTPMKSKKERMQVAQPAFELQKVSSKLTTPKKDHLKPKQSLNPFADSYSFPCLKIHIINKIQSVDEIEKSSLSFSFERIFKRMISTHLMGEFTCTFMLKMEHYIRQIVEKGELEDPLGGDTGTESGISEAWKSVSRKEDLLQMINELQMNGEQRKAQQLVKHYCIPSQPQSDNLHTSLMQQIVIDIYQKKNCRQDIKYCLLTEQGKLITHISQILFTTRALLLTPLNCHSYSYLNYTKVLEDHDKEQRMTFKESVRQNFVSKIVNHQIEMKVVNYCKHYKDRDTSRKEYQGQAQALLGEREKIRLQKGRESDRERERGKESGRERESEGKLSVRMESICPIGSFSGSSSMNPSKRDKKEEYNQIIRQLHRILDPSHKYTVRGKIDEKTEEEFAALYPLNDKYDLTFNYSSDNNNRLILKNLLENCRVFRGKEDGQMQVIVGVMQKMWGGQGKDGKEEKKGKEGSEGTSELREVEFWQFKQIFETAHGVASKEVIMKFVLSYLSFDEWGELSQSEMFQLLQNTVAVSHRGRSLEMMKRILWDWFQSCRLVENKVLRKRNMEMWYQPIRVVYLFLLSVIFGTEYTNFEQMLEELIKYQFF